MRTLILLLTVCTLSGCGLFKKTTKSSNTREVVNEVASKVDESKQEEIAKSQTENTQTNEKSSDQETRDIDSETTVTADEILVDKDGNISAKGGAKLDQKRKDKGTKDRQAEKNTGTDKKINEIGKTNERRQEEHKDEQKDVEKVKESESKPDPVGGVAMWIGITLGLLLLFFGFRWKRDFRK